ncbi:hypothetical protein LGL55_10480 [Clostridium tagluense]|uniref:hypothetical protein n=1 Tax=Clostridium tagluense TaxID=360422 RepID=UPI001CF4E9FB|nr:hypothetical protein [Clostridium tagluense]MCB2300634.1 hypothetical protein [Clostridium tagluense]MCB2311635.1 hypothetical protein [Clostridium tagluense]MCB2316359.1 hypothetical protein [Clostridium tagluense]MCB2321257.1 hypothetical protein [Clostridium tagluense]MCB2326228.1 hypothetical protein [Clostridium tagluense]
MNKLTAKQLKVNLQEIENVINAHEEWEEEYWTYKLALKKNEIHVNIFDDEWLEETFTIEIVEDNIDVENICKNVINHIYETEINSRQNYVNKTKAFNSRKIKSMSLWLSRNNIEKISKINMELVERYNTTIKMNNTLSTYKSYVSNLYNVMNVLCPTWKIEDIKDYVINRFEYFNVTDVEITITDNKIIANYNDNIFSVTIDSFSRRADIFRELHNKVKVLGEVA